jgi:Clostridial hydrophobic W
MSDATPAPQQLVKELKVSAHLMTLQPGVFCVYHSEGSPGPDPATGLPGARLTLPPGPTARNVSIRSFREDGWLGGLESAALVRVTDGPAQILMTVYQMPDSGRSAPKLQVMRLADSGAGVATVPDLPAPVVDQSKNPETVTGGREGAPAQEPEIAAHIQMRGDVLARLGDWVGERGSQRWVEGFAVAPRDEIHPDEIEYQAVLGRGWLSPWAEGGQFCGSRGMALPILGLRVRLRGGALATHAIEVSATFTDGTAIGPVAAGEPCEAASLAPLEAFQILVRRLEEETVEPAEAPPAVAETKKTRRFGRVPAAARVEPVLTAGPKPKEGSHKGGRISRSKGR